MLRVSLKVKILNEIIRKRIKVAEKPITYGGNEFLSGDHGWAR